MACRVPASAVTNECPGTSCVADPYQHRHCVTDNAILLAQGDLNGNVEGYEDSDTGEEAVSCFCCDDWMHRSCTKYSPDDAAHRKPYCIDCFLYCAAGAGWASHVPYAAAS
jgi:hypothetical protein